MVLINVPQYVATLKFSQNTLYAEDNTKVQVNYSLEENLDP